MKNQKLVVALSLAAGAIAVVNVVIDLTSQRPVDLGSIAVVLAALALAMSAARQGPPTGPGR